MDPDIQDQADRLMSRSGRQTDGVHCVSAHGPPEDRSQRNAVCQLYVCVYEPIGWAMSSDDIVFPLVRPPSVLLLASFFLSVAGVSKTSGRFVESVSDLRSSVSLWVAHPPESSTGWQVVCATNRVV